MIDRALSFRLSRAVLFSFVLLTAGLTQAKEPKFPPPDDARVAVVNGNMRVNGISSSVRQFDTKESLEDVVAFYRDEWGDGADDEPRYTITNVNPPWTVVSRVEDEYLMTVQVQPTNDGGSWGFLALSRLPARGRSPKLGGDFPSMRESHTLNEVVSKDPGQTGRTMLLGNKYNLRTNVAFYRDRFDANGWAFDMDKSIGGVIHVLALRKGHKRLNIVVAQANKNGSRIIVNEVTHDIL